LFSEASRPQAFKQLSARNFLRQHQYLKDITQLLIEDLPTVKLHGSIIRSVNFHLTSGLTDNPGQYRQKPVRINNSEHTPPDYQDIGSMVGDLCVFVTENWEHNDAFDLAAYTLWRLTWIHPFEDGNGRTANSIAYYILCRKFGFWLPGEITIPAYWRKSNDKRYYKALAAADVIDDDHPQNLSALSTLLKRALMNQLKSVKLD
jgi:Fic family protein